MRDLAGIVKDNREFSYRNQAIAAQRLEAETRDKLRFVLNAIDQELRNRGTVDWAGVRHYLTDAEDTGEAEA